MTRPSRKRKGVLFAVANTCEDVAYIFGWPAPDGVRHVREAIRENRLKAYRVPGGYRVLEHDIAVFMAPGVRDLDPNDPIPPTTVEDLGNLGIPPHEARRILKAGERKTYSVNAAADAVRMRPEKVKEAQRFGLLSNPITAASLEGWIRLGAPGRGKDRFDF